MVHQCASSRHRAECSDLITCFQVLIKSDMLDYYSVSGCYILKPWSYSIWEVIQGMLYSATGKAETLIS